MTNFAYCKYCKKNTIHLDYMAHYGAQKTERKIIKCKKCGHGHYVVV